MPKIGMIGHIDRGKTSLTSLVIRLLAMNDTKKEIIQSALNVGVAESAAVLIADDLTKRKLSVGESTKEPAKLNVQPAKETKK